MLSDSENPQHLELHEPVRAGERQEVALMLQGWIAAENWM